jgi:hypothetical protein
MIEEFLNLPADTRNLTPIIIGYRFLASGFLALAGYPLPEASGQRPVASSYKISIASP